MIEIDVLYLSDTEAKLLVRIKGIPYEHLLTYANDKYIVTDDDYRPCITVVADDVALLFTPQGRKRTIRPILEHFEIEGPFIETDYVLHIEERSLSRKLTSANFKYEEAAYDRK